MGQPTTVIEDSEADKTMMAPTKFEQLAKVNQEQDEMMSKLSMYGGLKNFHWQKQ